MSVGLIDFLRGWGESLFTSKKAYISNQAMPSTSEISVSASEGEGSFTAPTDGYLVLGASRKTSSDFAVVNIWNNINTCSVSSAGYGQSRAYVPCKKGKTVQFSIIGNVDRSAFISTIGGGT